MPGWATRLYHGENNYNFLRGRRWWYGLSAVMLLVSIVSLATVKLNFNVDFTGGSELYVSNALTCDVASAEKVVTDSGFVEQPRVQKLGNKDIRVQTDQLSEQQAKQLQQRLSQACGVPERDVSSRFVGGNWGGDVTKAAVKGLVAFLILVTIFLAFYFEWKMALAAMLALIHDIIITMGLYSLVGFEVSPATVIGLLTVLGYSLYDTVVVFDKVKENTAGLMAGSRSTYAEQTNLAVNQSLVRSVNTTILGILPVASIFFVGAYVLGAGTLKDIALVLLIGQMAGAYSSIFIAAPLLVQLKEREPAIQAHNSRVQQRRSGSRTQQDALAATPGRSSLPGTGARLALTGSEQEGEGDLTPDAQPARASGGATAAPVGQQRQQPTRKKAKGGAKKRK